jgi:hypothetical protein
VGYMGGIETFQAFVRKPENFLKEDTVYVEELLPLKGIAEDALAIGQEEMPDCRGIKHMGFEPHLLYDPEARAAARLSPRVERQADSDVDSIISMGFLPNRGIMHSPHRFEQSILVIGILLMVLSKCICFSFLRTTFFMYKHDF